MLRENSHYTTKIRYPASLETDCLPPRAPLHFYQYQFYAAFAACVGPISLGYVAGFSSPAMDGLVEKFHLSAKDQSLVSSLPTIGALFGGLIAGFLADYFGRKLAIMVISVPFVGGWVLIISAQNVFMLFVGRFITGLCIGAISMCAPVYVAEISSPEVRGVLGSLFQLFINIGIFLVYFLGCFVSWHYLALVSTIIASLSCLLMVPMPESPCWLISKLKFEEAKDAVIWLHGGRPTDIVHELLRIQTEQASEIRIVFKDYLKPRIAKPMVLMLIQMGIQQMSGINAILFNAVPILRSSSPTMDPHFCAVIIGFSLVLAATFTLFLMDTLGRRMLLMVSSIFMAGSMLSLGLYDYLKVENPCECEPKSSWLPVVTLVIFVVSFMMGFGPVPWVMMSEVFPRQARGVATSIVTAANWGMAFLVTKSFNDLRNILGESGVFWLYALVAALGSAYVYFQVPETKGRSLDDIEEYFCGQEPLLLK